MEDTQEVQNSETILIERDEEMKEVMGGETRDMKVKRRRGERG